MRLTSSATNDERRAGGLSDWSFVVRPHLSASQLHWQHFPRQLIPVATGLAHTSLLQHADGGAVVGPAVGDDSPDARLSEAPGDQRARRLGSIAAPLKRRQHAVADLDCMQ